MDIKNSDIIELQNDLVIWLNEPHPNQMRKLWKAHSLAKRLQNYALILCRENEVNPERFSSINGTTGEYFNLDYEKMFSECLDIVEDWKE